MEKPRILFCASEAAPFAKTGGLADVAEALPAALKELGCDVRVFIPLYRCVRDWVKSSVVLPAPSPITVGTHDYHVNLLETRAFSGIPLYLLEKDEFYDRSYLYGSPAGGDYEDNAERYITFCRAIPSLCHARQWYPSIFHLHDWQTGLAAAYHRLLWRSDPALAASRTVLTIHNLAYQGIFPSHYFSLTNLPQEAFSIRGLEFWGKCNFLKAGLIYSDHLTTVSPRYSREIQREEAGYGLHGVLLNRADRLSGILNGIDQTVWDPRTDSFIPQNYSATRLAGKRQCKTALLAELGFAEEASKLVLVGMIGRLATQKGYHLLIDMVEELMALPVVLVILGSGDAQIEGKLQAMAERFPERIKICVAFNEPLAHRIEAGADLFLMPSAYEPCGLNQMYSLRYGTIPIVHATGGLDDSVVDVVAEPSRGTGFKFYRYDASALLDSVKAALELFRNRDEWLALQRRAMAQEFSWQHAAEQYLEVYERVLSEK